MSKRKGTSEPVDSQRRISVTVWPYSTYSVATVDIGWRDGSGPCSSRLARWHLRLTRTDLAGHTTDDVLRVIVDCLVHRLESGPDPADYRAAVGPGAPLGATGGTVTTDPPEGQQPDPPVLPGS